VNYLKHQRGTSQPYHEAREMAKPLTPASERPRWTRGSVLFSPPDSTGLCVQPKCIRRENHAGGCWPS